LRRPSLAPEAPAAGFPLIHEAHDFMIPDDFDLVREPHSNRCREPLVSVRGD
jgi:hypothetical protein